MYSGQATFLLAMIYLESNKAAVILFCSAGNNDIPDLQRARKECYFFLMLPSNFFFFFFFFFQNSLDEVIYIYIYKQVLFLSLLFRHY